MDTSCTTVDVQCWEKISAWTAEQTLGKVAQGSCGISSLGNVQNSTKQGPEQPELPWSRDSDEMSSRGSTQPELLYNSMKALCEISCAEGNSSKSKRKPRTLAIF